MDQLSRASPSKPNDRVFHEEGLTHGLAYASDGKARAGMGIAEGDLYGDGGEAVIVTNLPNEAFTLFQRQPNGDFFDATEQSGLVHISAALYRLRRRLVRYGKSRTAGHVQRQRRRCSGHDARSERRQFPYRERKLLLRNMGKGKGFEDITASAGPDLQPREVSRAAVFGDLNNDGGVDILVTNNNGPARLYLNTVPDRGHWLLVRLEGVRTNRSGYGSVVELVRQGWHVGQALGERRRQLSRGQRSENPLRAG